MKRIVKDVGLLVQDEFTRMINEQVRRQTTKVQMQRVELESYRDLERKFAKIKVRINTMRDHATEEIGYLQSMA